tara:strand:- start:1347 stop:2036 length:690 start_codon:yes stop_codon:yes gene_type:complete
MSSPPIIALHGNLGAAHDWERLNIPGVDAVDLWAFSDLPLDEFAMFLTEEIVDSDDRPNIAGYSLGGRLALQTLASFPDRWGGAVILSAHPGLTDEAEKEARRTADGEWAEKARTLLWEEFLQEWNDQPMLSDSPVSKEQQAVESHREAVAMAFEYWSLGTQSDLREPLQEFEGPVLWITGERDQKFHRFGEEMSEVFGSFEHVVLPGHGHRCLTPDAAAVIRDWQTQF